MKNGKTKRYSFFVVLGLILSYIIINSCSQEEPLIKDVSIKAIIADTRIFGDKVGDTKYIPPAPWRTRFKIALNGKKLDKLQPNRDSRFDTTLFNFEGTLIDFRGSNPAQVLTGFHFRTLPNDMLEADFEIPMLIENWNFKKDPVVMVVRVTTTDGGMTQKAEFSLLSLAFPPPPESDEGERRINEAMYEGENSFEGTFGDGNTTNAPINGTEMDDPD